MKKYNYKITTTAKRIIEKPFVLCPTEVQLIHSNINKSTTWRLTTLRMGKEKPISIGLSCNQILFFSGQAKNLIPNYMATSHYFALEANNR